MAYASLAILAACLLPAPLHAQAHRHGRRLAGDDDHAGHDHGDHAAAYEWAGIFEVPDAKYMWTAQKVEGAYADASMKIAALPASEATAAKLSALAKEGEHSLEANCSVLQPGGVITPKEDACYKLQFDAGLWQSLYTVNTSGAAAVAFFTEHVPTEFESTAHYLKDSSGEDIEPLAELPEAEEEEASADWGGSIGASLIVNMITLTGVLMLAPGIATLAATHTVVIQGILSAFAAGALLACAFFLLLFESTHLIGEGWDEEVDVLWRWGTMVLAGFMLPAVLQTATLMVMTAMETQAPAQAEEVAVEAGVADGKETASSISNKARVIGAVLLGDFFHNLCDGFFIAAAFKGCGGSFAWGVVLGTCLHELPQELADYAILTGPVVGMKPVKALALNFLAGLSVILGAVIINASDVDNSSVGLLLAFGGGTYVYLAATECMPKIHELKLSLKENLGCLLAFTLGAILIGLILLDHKHCVAEGGHGHGHGHGH